MSEFTHSRVLFVTSDSQPMKFSMRPCAEKVKLRPVIEHGGGMFTINRSGSIYLVEPSSKVLSYNENIVSSRYIWDCVKENRLLDINKYKISCSVCAGDNIRDVDDSKDIEPVLKRANSRWEYTNEEDNAIINFIINTKRYSNVRGNSLWKLMEHRQAVKHRTWQSLKSHFLKQILPNIEQFPLTEEQKSRFTNLSKDLNGNDERLAAPKNMYKPGDDVAILNYILNKRKINEVKGVNVWKDMEEEYVTSHSWQSMKERFLKHIVPNIERYGIEPEKIRMISKVLLSSKGHMHFKDTVNSAKPKLSSGLQKSDKYTQEEAIGGDKLLNDKDSEPKIKENQSQVKNSQCFSNIIKFSVNKNMSKINGAYSSSEMASEESESDLEIIPSKKKLRSNKVSKIYCKNTSDQSKTLYKNAACHVESEVVETKTSDHHFLNDSEVNLRSVEREGIESPSTDECFVSASSSEEENTNSSKSLIKVDKFYLRKRCKLSRRNWKKGEQCKSVCTSEYNIEKKMYSESVNFPNKTTNTFSDLTGNKSADVQNIKLNSEQPFSHSIDMSCNKSHNNINVSSKLLTASFTGSRLTRNKTSCNIQSVGKENEDGSDKDESCSELDYFDSSIIEKIRREISDGLKENKELRLSSTKSTANSEVMFAADDDEEPVSFSLIIQHMEENWSSTSESHLSSKVRSVSKGALAKDSTIKSPYFKEIAQMKPVLNKQKLNNFSNEILSYTSSDRTRSCGPDTSHRAADETLEKPSLEHNFTETGASTSFTTENLTSKTNNKNTLNIPFKQHHKRKLWKRTNNLYLSNDSKISENTYPTDGKDLPVENYQRSNLKNKINPDKKFCSSPLGESKKFKVNSILQPHVNDSIPHTLHSEKITEKDCFISSRNTPNSLSKQNLSKHFFKINNHTCSLSKECAANKMCIYSDVLKSGESKSGHASCSTLSSLKDQVLSFDSAFKIVEEMEKSIANKALPNLKHKLLSTHFQNKLDRLKEHLYVMFLSSKVQSIMNKEVDSFNTEDIAAILKLLSVQEKRLPEYFISNLNIQNARKLRKCRQL